MILDGCHVPNTAWSGCMKHQHYIWVLVGVPTLLPANVSGKEDGQSY